jgi:hypothetical protein
MEISGVGFVVAISRATQKSGLEVAGYRCSLLVQQKTDLVAFLETIANTPSIMLRATVKMTGSESLKSLIARDLLF